MKKRILKSLVLLILVGVLSVGATYSSFYNKVSSLGNSISAATLSFQTLDDNANDISDLFDLQSASSGQTYSRDINMKNNGSLNFDYKIEVTNISGDNDLCSALKLNSINNANTYVNNLSDFLIGDLSLSKNDNSLFQYSLKIPDGDSYKGKSCSFNLKINAFQNGLNENSGFTFVKDIPSTIQVEKLQPELNISLSNTNPTLTINVSNISDYTNLMFQYTYKKSGEIEEGGQGQQSLSGDSSFTKNILLGSQSGPDFVYDTGIHDINVSVTLTDSSNNTKILSDSL